MLTARVSETQRPGDSGLWDKKQFVVIGSKLGTGLGRGRYDRCCVAISGARKRHEAVQMPQSGNPLLLVIGLAKTLNVREATVKRSDDEGYRSFPQIEGEKAG